MQKYQNIHISTEYESEENEKEKVNADADADEEICVVEEIDDDIELEEEN